MVNERLQKFSTGSCTLCRQTLESAFQILGLKQLNETHDSSNLRNAFQDNLDECHVSYSEVCGIAMDSGPNLKAAIRELGEFIGPSRGYEVFSFRN